MTSTSHINETDLKQENTESIKSEPLTQPQIRKIKEDQTDLPKLQSEPKASTSEPQESETESLLVKRPGKRKLKKEQVPHKDNDRLIQLVRSMRCLYDPQHPRYRDTQVRRDLWNIIGKALDMPGNACEESWQKLIVKFKKSENKNRDFDQLMWLLRYISRDEAESVESESDNQNTNSNSNGGVEFLHANDCQCNTAAFAHPMQKFLAEISTMLKKLPPQEQKLAKIEIFEIVHKFDLKKSTEVTVAEIKTEIDSDG